MCGPGTYDLKTGMRVDSRKLQVSQEAFEVRSIPLQIMPFCVTPEYNRGLWNASRFSMSEPLCTRRLS
jgi:hypothetical protein